MAVENVEEVVATMLEDEILRDDPEHFLVNVAYKGNTASGKLLVEVDGDQGMSIDRCGEISRQLGKLLEERDPIKGKYILEVTSPGADKPLKLLRQYHKHVGRRLHLSLVDGTVTEGKLLDVGEDSIRLEVKDKKGAQEVQVALGEVLKTKVLVSFK